jgi:hypothetical protein
VPIVDTKSGRILSTRERIAYSVFNGADLLIKNLIGKYLFFFYTTTLGVNPLWIAVGQPLVKSSRPNSVQDLPSSTKGFARIRN